MTLFEAVILGIVQGLTEFLPISSSAHLRIVPELFGWRDPGAAFSAVIQLGTVLALLVYFKNDLLSIGKGMWRDAVCGQWRGSSMKLGMGIIAGTIPIAVIGLLFKHQIENQLRGMQLIGCTLIGFGILLYLSEKARRAALTIEGLSFRQIQLIGLAQALALVPGASRSGVTLTAALFLGMKRDEAARFSFLLGIPAVTAAGIFELKDLIADHSGISPADIVTGVLVSAISGWIAIDVLLKYLKTRTTTVFVVYRVMLGAAILGYLFTR